MSERSIAAQFEAAWQQGESPRIDSFLTGFKFEQRRLLLPRLLAIDIQFRTKLGESVTADDYSTFGTDAVDLAAKLIADNPSERSENGPSDFNEKDDDEAVSIDPTIAGEQTIVADDDWQPESTPDVTAFSRSADFIDAASPRTETSPPPAPETIGPYKLLQQIGEGGMGTVWMAEQQQPVRRRVAIKLIKSELASKQIIARFEAERQALAMMDHQNIARVLDAGTTDSGSPYFVMELVKGIPITKYCDDRRLGIRERLELFIPVCGAVQHAHQKGIIHRDLKPSNVLVAQYDGHAVPKVIDFGLAKALEHTTQLTDKTVFTKFGQVVGTLQYMSPEQAEMTELDIDTRSDIYSLGVMLYELLTGTTPIEHETLRQNAMLQVLQVIREKDPPLPSARLSSSSEILMTGISDRRGIAPSRLRQILRGELDWVVMKALDKDRSRRYETATGFADDVRRYLNNEAIEARPPSTAYRIRKFVTRNRGLVASLAMIGLLLVAGIATSSWFAVEANLAKRHLATKAQDESEQRMIAEQKTEEATKLAALADQARRDAESQTAIATQATADLADRLEYSEVQQYASKMQQVLLAQQTGAFEISFEKLKRADVARRGWEYDFLLAQQRRTMRYQTDRLITEGAVSLNAILRDDILYFAWSDYAAVDLASGTESVIRTADNVRDFLCTFDLNPAGDQLLVAELNSGVSIIELSTRRQTKLVDVDYLWILDFVQAETRNWLEAMIRPTRFRPRYISNDRVVAMERNVVYAIGTDREKIWNYPLEIGRKAFPSGFQFDPINNRIAVWFADQVVILDADNGQVVTRHGAGNEPVVDLIFVDDGERVLVALPNRIDEISLLEDKVVETFPIADVIHLAWHANTPNRLYVIESDSNYVSTVEFRSRTIERNRLLNLNAAEASGFALSDDGRSILYNNSGGWNVRSTDAEADPIVAEGVITRIESLGGSVLLLVELLATNQTRFSTFDTATGATNEIQTIDGTIRDLAVATGGNLISFMVEKVDARKNVKYFVEQLDFRSNKINRLDSVDLDNSIFCLSPDGKKLIERAGDPLFEEAALVFRDLENKIKPQRLKLFDVPALDPDADPLAGFRNDDDRQASDPSQILFAAGLSKLIDGSDEGFVRLIDMETADFQTIKIDSIGRLIDATFAHEQQLLFLTFATRGDDMLANRTMSRIVCWDLANEKLKYAIDGHMGTTRSMIVDSKGQRLISSGSDGSIKIWDVASGIEILSIPFGLVSINDLHFDEAKATLWFASDDGLGRLSTEARPVQAVK